MSRSSGIYCDHSIFSNFSLGTSMPTLGMTNFDEAFRACQTMIPLCSLLETFPDGDSSWRQCVNLCDCLCTMLSRSDKNGVWHMFWRAKDQVGKAADLREREPRLWEIKEPQCSQRDLQGINFPYFTDWGSCWFNFLDPIFCRQD